MIDKSVYVASLFLQPDQTALIFHAAGALLPGFLAAVAMLRGNRFLAAVGFTTLNALVVYGLNKYFDGGYSFWLYSIMKPIHETGLTEMIAPNPTDLALVYGLPALLHGIIAAIVAVGIGVTNRR